MRRVSRAQLRQRTVSTATGTLFSLAYDKAIFHISIGPFIEAFLSSSPFPLEAIQTELTLDSLLSPSALLTPSAPITKLVETTLTRR